MPILATMGLKKIYIAPAMTDGSMPCLLYTSDAADEL